MQEIRKLKPAEIAALQHILNLEGKDLRNAYKICVIAAIGMAAVSLWFLFAPGNGGNVEFPIAVGVGALTVAVLAMFLRQQARPLQYEFGAVQELTGAFRHRLHRYGTSYFFGERRIKIPPLWKTERQFKHGDDATIHFASVKCIRDGALVGYRDLGVEIPGFQKITEHGWPKVK